MFYVVKVSLLLVTLTLCFNVSLILASSNETILSIDKNVSLNPPTVTQTRNKRSIDKYYDANFYKFPEHRTKSKFSKRHSAKKSKKPVKKKKRTSTKKRPQIRQDVRNDKKRKGIARNYKTTPPPKRTPKVRYMERTIGNGTYDSQVVIINGIEYPSIVLGKLLIQNLTTTPFPTPEGMADNYTILSAETRFTNFLQVLLKLMVKKNLRDAKQIYLQAEKEVTQLHQFKRLEDFGEVFCDAFLHLFQLFNSIPPSAMRIAAAKGFYYLAYRRNGTLDAEMNSILDMMDDVYFEDDDVEFSTLQVLTDINSYPNGTKTAHAIVRDAFQTLLINPLRKLAGSAVLDRLVTVVNRYIQTRWYPDMRKFGRQRARKETALSSDSTTTTSTTTTNEPTRSAIQVIETTQVEKKNHRDKHHKMLSKNETEKKTRKHKKSKKKSHKVKIDDNKYEEDEKYYDFSDLEYSHDYYSGEYDDFIDVYSKEIVDKNERKSLNLLKLTISNTKNDRKTNSISFKGGRFPIYGTNKRNNFRYMGHSNKRYNIKAIQKTLRTKAKGKKAMGINEKSSYSDEEDELKANLYDAFRHFDVKHVVNPERRIRTNKVTANNKVNTKSSYEDYEAVIKSKIYKSFGNNIEKRYKNAMKKIERRVNKDFVKVKINTAKLRSELRVLFTKPKVKTIVKPLINIKSSYSDDEEVLKHNLYTDFVVTPIPTI